MTPRPHAKEWLALPGPAVGLVSDSHGHARRTRRAVEMLLAAGARSVLHLGDLCDTRVIDALAGLRTPEGVEVPARLVWGNCDPAPSEGGWTAYARSLGVGVDDPAGRYEIGGRRLVAHHGHDPAHERAAVEGGADYFLHGHTHTPRDERAGRTRLINPGALQRAARWTVALLDVERGDLKFFEVSRSGG